LLRTVVGQLQLAEISRPQNCFICVGVKAFAAVCNGSLSGYVATGNCCKFRVLIQLI